MPSELTELQPCGTVTGYRRHLSNGEETCAACRAAWNERFRAYRPAYNAAMAQLRQRHRQEHTSLLRQITQRLRAEGAPYVVAGRRARGKADTALRRSHRSEWRELMAQEVAERGQPVRRAGRTA